MPRINEYGAPELSAPDNKEVSYSSLKYSEGESEGLRKIGNTVSDIGQAMYERTAQTEVSDLNAKFAEARADWTTKIDDHVRKGDLDVNKVNQEYQDYINKMNDGLETSQGQNFFNKQAGRLKGYVLKASMRGQATLAGVKAESDWRSAIASHSSALDTDPSGFKDIYDSSIEAIDAQVSTGAMPEKIAEKFKYETGVKLAESAVRGWANLSPEIASKKLQSGEFDQYFDGDKKAELQGYIHQAAAAKETDARRAVIAQEKAQKAASEAWQQKALPDLAKAALPTKAILDSPMDANEKIRWMKLADEAAKEGTQTNPAVFNEVIRNAQLPDSDPNKKVRGITDLAQYANNGLSLNDVEKVNTFMQKLPEEENIRDNRKRLLDIATAKLVKKDAMLGLADPDGEQNLLSFTVALQQQEAQLRKDKKPISDLYNPNSKDYFGNQLQKYELTPTELMKKQAESLTGPSPDMVSVVDAKGKRWKVPKANLEKVKAQGYKEVTGGG